jgi:hypothetical protein
MDSYNAIIVAHPASDEAGYSRTQIRNIAITSLAMTLLGDDRDNKIADVASGEEVS